MALPSTGWLDIGQTGSLEVLDLELPVDYVGTYREGVTLYQEVIIPTTNLEFTQLSQLATLADSTIVIGHTLTGARAFEISLIRRGVYGFLLIDSFTPPLITQEFFEFDADTQLSCVGSSFIGTPPTYSTCARGNDTEYVEGASTTPTFEDA